MGHISKPLVWVALAASAACGCGDSTAVSQSSAGGAAEAHVPLAPPGPPGSAPHGPAEDPPPPDVPATAEPCTPGAEILALFDEYQTAFEDADGLRFLSLHTPEERDRQIVACLQIIRDRFRNQPEAAALLAECQVTSDLLDVAAAHNPNDPVESSVAIKTIVPRLAQPERLVSATLAMLADRGPVHPELFNLEVNGDAAAALLALQYPRHQERSRLEFARVNERWLIAAETSAPSSSAPTMPRLRGMP